MPQNVSLISTLPPNNTCEKQTDSEYEDYDSDEHYLDNCRYCCDVLRSYKVTDDY